MSRGLSVVARCVVGVACSIGMSWAMAFEAPASVFVGLVAPGNDSCGGAEVIPGNGSFPYLTSVTADITDATITGDPPAPSCQPGISRSIWYSFTPSATASYTFSSCADAPTGSTVDDTVLAVYTSAGGCAGPFTELGGACDDDSCGTEDFQAVVSSILDAGTTYYIVVWQFGDAAPAPGNTAVQLRVSKRVINPPANDTCAGAQAISGALPFLTALTADITDARTIGDPPPPSCQPDVSRSIWYTFTPPTSGTYMFSSCADAPTGTTVDDTVMAIYTSAGGCAGPFSEVAGACDNDTCHTENLQAVVTAALSSGTTYYILAWQSGSAPPTAGNTAVQLLVSQPAAASNDVCGSATPLALETPVSGTTAFANDDYELSGAACFTGIGQVASTAPGRDVAYSFVAPAAGEYSFRVTEYGSSLNLVLYVASSCPAGSPPIAVASCLAAANRPSSGSSEEVMCLPLANGQAVYAFVDENTLTAGSPFKIEVTECVRETEPNDSPATAGPLACGLEGTISPVNEADFFVLGSPTSGSRVFALVDGVAANLNDFDLRVTTTSDTKEYDDQNNDTPFAGLAPNVGGTPLAGVPSYLRANYFSTIRTAEPYRLYAAIQPGSSAATPETEPNDTIANANTAPNDYFSGAFASVGDVDVFRFTANAHDTIFLSLDGDPLRNNTPINAGVALLDVNGTALLTVNDSGSTSSTTSGDGSLTAKNPNSPSEGLVYRAETSGNYFARLTSASIGDYLLSIALDCRVLPATDLALTKTDAPDPVFTGSPLTYTLTAANLGPATARNVILTDTLPSGMSFVSATPSQGSCSGSNAITCFLGDIASGAIATVTIVVTPTAAGTRVNAASVRSTVMDSAPSNDVATASTTVLDPVADTDGDGVGDLSDCAPLDPSAFAVPAEVSGVTFTSKTSFQWGSLSVQAGSGTVYDVVRGSGAEFPVGSGPSETCLNNNLATTSWSDGTPLGAGQGRWYLVRAENVCGHGSYGTRSSGAPRVTSACP